MQIPSRSSADELELCSNFLARLRHRLSNNELNEREVSTLESSLANNMSLTSLDLRNNRLSRESDALDRIAMVVRKNELDARK